MAWLAPRERGCVTVADTSFSGRAVCAPAWLTMRSPGCGARGALADDDALAPRQRRAAPRSAASQ